jgi:hypothetical protein
MKKVVHQNAAVAAEILPVKKIGRENVWCDKFSYFIDLNACEARSYQKSVCRRCFATLIQLSLPFE